MIQVLWLLAAQGAIGAFDTLYFHEWRARLPALGLASRPELKLHAARSLIYFVLFATLPWIAWHGAFALFLVGLLATEIITTLTDFSVETRVRAPLGGVYAGERTTHAIMGIVYGATLAFLLPVMWSWWKEPTSLILEPVPVPAFLRFLLAGMALGVLASGVRDALAAAGVRGASWPWTKLSRDPQGQVGAAREAALRG